MTPEQFEERIRRAMATRTMTPPVFSSTRPNRGMRWALLGATAAGLALLIPVLQREEPPHATAPRATPPVREESFFLPAALLAQSSSSPAYPTLSTRVRSDLRPGRWRLGQVVDGRVREHYDYALAQTRYHTEPAWLVISQYYYGDKVRTIDSTWTTSDSLEPRLRISTAGSMRIERTYRGEDVLIGTTQNGYTSWSSASLRPPSWEAGHSVLQVSGVALRFQTTTLARDWKRSLPYPVMTSRDSVVYLNLVVDGEEQIEVPAGSFAAWRIRLQIGDRPLKPYDPANPPAGIYYWVSKERQWMLKMAFVGNGGPETTPIVLLSGEEY